MFDESTLKPLLKKKRNYFSTVEQGRNDFVIEKIHQAILYSASFCKFMPWNLNI